MNLNRLRFWKPRTVSSNTAALEGEAGGETAAEAAQPSPTVIQLRPDSPGANFIDADDNATDGDSDSPSFGTGAPDRLATPAIRFRGMFNSPDLDRFFQDRYFAYGKYAGIRYKSAEALAQGLDALIAKFQNILVNLIERRRAKLNRLQSVIISTETVNATMTARLRLGVRQLEDEMALLGEQIRLATDRKGWVLDALNQYRLGFDRGMYEALESELLTD